MALKNEVTEDDIKIAKERRTCLVHKGPITGFSFICPKCGAIYCQKCFKAIEDIENTCWSCSSPLDPTKAAKTIKEEELSEEIVEKELKEEEIKPKK